MGAFWPAFGEFVGGSLVVPGEDERADRGRFAEI
jgi:hypothetical protein